MKIAIMQPYFFPYVGYFELINTVDTFIFLNDVQYIRGWINRNRIRSTEKDFKYLTVPVKKHSQKTPINEIKISESNWLQEHSNLISRTYGDIKTHELYKYFQSLNKFENLQDLLFDSIKWSCDYLGIKTNFCLSENISNRKKQYRIIDICHEHGATTYFNLSGGKSLYNEAEFLEEGIKLEFMNMTNYPNKLSIIDVILTEPNIKQWFKK